MVAFKKVTAFKSYCKFIQIQFQILTKHKPQKLNQTSALKSWPKLYLKMLINRHLQRPESHLSCLQNSRLEWVIQSLTRVALPIWSDLSPIKSKAAINWSFGLAIDRSAQSSTDIFSKLKVRGWLFDRSNLNANTKTIIRARAQSN